MYDVIIVGAGPAGISASLYAKRGNLNVLVLYRGESQLEKAHMIDNYYGFPGGISGKDLYEAGIEQAKKLGVDVKEEEVTNIEMIDLGKYKVKTEENEYETGAIIIATGNKKVKPNIKGIEEFDGKGISYCAICDGFFFKNKIISLIGNSNYVVSECSDLINLSDNINIFTNGEKTSNEVLDYVKEHPNIKVYNDKIVEVVGTDFLEGIALENGEVIPSNGLFIANGIASTNNIAKKLGIIMENNFIKVDSNYETNVKGCFAIGDSIGGLLQISKSVSDGAICATYINKLLKEKE